MGPPHLQLSCSLAIPGKLLPTIIHNAHVHKQVSPPLALPVPQLLLLAQGTLAALKPPCGGVRHSVTSTVLRVGARVGVRAVVVVGVRVVVTMWRM